MLWYLLIYGAETDAVEKGRFHIQKDRLCFDATIVPGVRSALQENPGGGTELCTDFHGFYVNLIRIHDSYFEFGFDPNQDYRNSLLY